MYKVVEYFTDLQDKSYAYNVGDVYPHKGYTPSDERIEELATDKNVRKRPVIELVTASKKVVVEETAEEKPKKRGKNREE